MRVLKATTENRSRCCGEPVASRLATGHRPLPAAAGFTLIEMLIVVSIMMLLVGMTAAVMRPATESRRTREAARMVNVYLSSARNRAIETGRPCGVLLRCATSGTCATTLDQCEVPASAAGLLESSTMVVTGGTSPGVGMTIGSVTALATYNDFDTSMVSVGDTIQLNGQGPWFTITGTTSGNLAGTATTGVTGTLSMTTGQRIPWDTTANTVSYCINRLPTATNMIKGGARPLPLPTATVIDLTASGWDGSTQLTAGTDSFILFSPSGSIEYVYCSGNSLYPTDPICLLVGKRERVDNSFIEKNSNETTLTNYQDLNNFWIVINPQTGLVTTGEVTDSTSGTDSADAVRKSRTLALEMQGMGGK